MEIRVLVIINPTSGKGNTTEYSNKIRENLEKQNMQVNIKITQKDHNAKDIVTENVSTTDLILVCGGDGTFNETVSALMDLKRQDISIAYIPMGTTNDLARSLKMPLKDISISNNLLKSKPNLLDIGSFNENKYFCYVAAFGVMTDVSYKTSQKAKNKYGKLAYYGNAIKELIKMPVYKTKIFFDDEEIEGEFVYGGITNSMSIGGFKWFDENEISLNDGKFEALFIRKPKKLSSYFRLLSDFRNKDYMSNRDFVYFKANDIIIETEQEVAWTTDGEYAGNTNYVHIKNHNKAIEIDVCQKTEK